MFNRVLRFTLVLAALLMGIALASGVRVAQPVQGQHVLTSAQQAGPYMVAGVIKPDGKGGWYILNDAGHQSSGNLKVTAVDGTYITVTYTPGSKVVSFLVGTDELLGGKLHYVPGASAGLGLAKISMSNDLGPVDPRKVTNTSGNLWVEGWLLP